jgi:hypothetical protein
MLKETHGLKELEFRVENLPFLAKSIRIAHDTFTITGNHVAHSEISQYEADTLAKMLELCLLKHDRHKVLVGLDPDAIVPAQMNFKDMLLNGGLRMQVLKSPNSLGKSAPATPLR